MFNFLGPFYRLPLSHLLCEDQEKEAILSRLAVPCTCQSNSDARVLWSVKGLALSPETTILNTSSNSNASYQKEKQALETVNICLAPLSRS